MQLKIKYIAGPPSGGALFAIERDREVILLRNNLLFATDIARSLFSIFRVYDCRNRSPVFAGRSWTMSVCVGTLKAVAATSALDLCHQMIYLGKKYSEKFL